MPLLIAPLQARDFPTRRDGTMRKRQALSPDRARELNPLLSLTEDWMRAPGGYTEHVHRGYQTVTLVLGGQLRCKDSLGGEVLLGAGDAQWATVGRGLSHAELPEGEEEVHLLQLWLNLPAAQKFSPPRVQDLLALEVPVWTAPGALARVLAGELEGLVGPVRAGVRLLELRLEAGASWSLPFGPAQRALLYLSSGSMEAGPHQLGPGGGLQLTSEEASALPLRGLAASHLLVVSAPPLLEPVEVSGPFIVNTKAEVKQAHDDFRAGRL
jgi:redox-sensitive bicupin YhaK (pirin superfamily)